MVGRREFLQWSSLLAGWKTAAAPRAEDGEWGRGWELGPGCEIVGNALRVRGRGSATARVRMLSPRAGRTYTVRGKMRTVNVAPLEEGGGAVASVERYEFAARPVGGGVFEKLTGTEDWTPFTHTFQCHPEVWWQTPEQPSVVWLELALGLYRAEGEVWFTEVAVVEEVGEYPAPRRSVPAVVAIWRDDVPARGTASDPEWMARTLREAGYGVEFVDTAQLAQIARTRFDIVALPYGASFPPQAEPALREFLSQGGSFFSTGGYAFDKPLAAPVEGVEAMPQPAPHVQLTAAEEDCLKTPVWEADVAVNQARERFEFTCRARTEAVSDRWDGYAVLALVQLDAARKPIRESRVEAARLRGSMEWRRCRAETVAYTEAKWVRISVGLQHTTGKLWVEEASLRRMGVEIRINTSRGDARDGLDVAPEQIGVFNPDYRLRRVSYLKTAPGQEVVRTAYRVEGLATGYAASGVLGAANARWTPLVNAYDGHGRLRGAAGALMRHYHGPYRKSHWAFFGVENRDLFAPENPGAKALLVEVFDALARKTFLEEVRTDLASYRQGEEVRIETRVHNYGARRRKLRASVVVSEQEAGARSFATVKELELEPDTSAPVEARWKPARFAARRYSVRVELAEAGTVIDHVETGFLIWDEQVLRDGFPLRYSDNYFRRGERAVFLTGSDDYLHTCINRHENPKTWRKDISKLKDHFLLVYENLLGDRGLDDVPTEAWWRQCDALVQICQELKIVFFPGLLVFANVAAGEADQQRQREFCRAFARRYGLSPGLIYCLNGDLQVRDARLPALTGAEPWEDVRAYDNYHSRADLVRRWLDAAAGALREVDARHPVQAEFYARPSHGVDVVTAIGTLDAGNIGYFDGPGEDFYNLPQVLGFADLRARGKSLMVGEFGVKTHPAWSDHGHIQAARTEIEQCRTFLRVPHYVVGMGGSRVQNWCWKYPADFPFEWGVNYPCDGVGADALAYYRNAGLFFRQFDWKYAPAEVFFLIADHHRMGGQGEAVRGAQLNAIRFLIDLHCPFGTIDEFYLESLPRSCKVLVYPIPFCPDDATFARLCRFVEEGGTLYVSGDISYDPERRRSRKERLEKLLGVTFEAENYPNIAFPGHRCNIRPEGKLAGLAAYDGYPCIRVKPGAAQVVAHAEDGAGVVFTNRVGKGKVFYSTDPVELHAPARTTAHGRMVYASFLAWAGAGRLQMEPDDAGVHLFRSATSAGEMVFTLVNQDERARSKRVSFATPAGAVKVDVARGMTAAVVVRADGAVSAIETSGKLEANGSVYCEADGHVMLFSLDGRDVRRSEMLCLLPMGEGTVQAASERMRSGAQFEVGEFRDAHWVAFEKGRLAVREASWSMEVNPDRNLSLVLVAAPERMPEARRRLTELLTLETTANPGGRGARGV
jgi:hypothetical protein